MPTIRSSVCVLWMLSSFARNSFSFQNHHFLSFFRRDASCIPHNFFGQHMRKTPLKTVRVESKLSINLKFKDDSLQNESIWPLFGQDKPDMSPLHPSDTSIEPVDLRELKKRRGSPNLPQHIAIIMDGNRRFAKNIMMPAEYGHLKGKETLEQVVRCDEPPTRSILPPSWPSPCGLQTAVRPSAESAPDSARCRRGIPA
jgi:hypothetical protein